MSFILILTVAALTAAGYLLIKKHRNGRALNEADEDKRITIETVEDEEQFRRLRDDWNLLLAASDSESVFLTWEWLYYWWVHFKENKKLFLLVARFKGNGKIIGIAPLFRTSTRLFGIFDATRIKFLGSERVSSDFLDFIIASSWEAAVIEGFYRYLALHRGLWDIIELSDFDRSSVPLHFLRRVNTVFKTVLSPGGVCPYIKLPSSYDDFLKTLEPRMRYELRKKTRNLALRHHISITDEDAPETLNDRIDLLFRLHGDGFQLKDYDKYGDSSFSGSAVRRFHSDVIPQFRSRNLLKFYFMSQRNAPIACLYAFEFKNRMYCYQTGFDRSWRKESPGTVLYGHCVRESIEKGIKEFHYLRGAEEYKARWTKTAVQLQRLTVLNDTLQGRLYWLYAAGKNGIKRMLRKHPVIAWQMRV